MNRLAEFLLRMGLGTAVLVVGMAFVIAVIVTRGLVLLIPAAYLVGSVIRDPGDDDDIEPNYPATED